MDLSLRREDAERILAEAIREIQTPVSWIEHRVYFPAMANYAIALLDARAAECIGTFNGSRELETALELELIPDIISDILPERSLSQALANEQVPASGHLIVRADSRGLVSASTDPAAWNDLARLQDSPPRMASAVYGEHGDWERFVPSPCKRTLRFSGPAEEAKDFLIRAMRPRIFYWAGKVQAVTEGCKESATEQKPSGASAEIEAGASVPEGVERGVCIKRKPPARTRTDRHGESAVDTQARDERAARRQAVVMPILRNKRWKMGRLATNAGVGKNSVYEYLDGTTGKITHENREAIAAALGLKPEQIPD